MRCIEPFDSAALAARLVDAGLDVVVVDTRAHVRGEFLRRPDLVAGCPSRLLRSYALARPERRRVAPVWTWSSRSATASPPQAGFPCGSAGDGYCCCPGHPGITVGPVVVVPFGRVRVLNDIGDAIVGASRGHRDRRAPGTLRTRFLSVYFEVAPRSGLDDSSPQLHLQHPSPGIADRGRRGAGRDADRRGAAAWDQRHRSGNWSTARPPTRLVAEEPAGLSDASPRLPIRGEDG